MTDPRGDDPYTPMPVTLTTNFALDGSKFQIVVSRDGTPRNVIEIDAQTGDVLSLVPQPQSGSSSET